MTLRSLNDPDHLPSLDPTEIPRRFAQKSAEILGRMQKTAPSSTIETVLGLDGG